MSRHWSEWRLFPDPRTGDVLTAPIGPGCYELKLRSNGELILFGMAGNVATRISSLLPKPFGCGTRNNSAKRDFVFEALGDIEYRTVATISRFEAIELEGRFKKADYRFST